jgi:hypothetical protein
MSKFARKTIALIKAEVAPGTDIVPAAANAVMIRNPNLTPLDMTYEERNIVRGFFGNFDALPTIKKVKFNFETEFSGSGTAGTAPGWDDIMQAAGHSSTNVPATSQSYACLSGTGKTVSIYVQIDGLQHKMVWGRGTGTIKLKANGIPYIAWEFIALDTGATDVANVTPAFAATYFKPQPVNKQNTPTCTLGGIAIALESLDFNFGNSNAQVTRPNSEQILHVDRKTVGSIMFEMTSVATKDWLAAVKAATLQALNIVHGVGAGQILTLAAANVQLQNPTFSEIQGIQMVQFQIRALPTNAGNDEYTLVNT